jgi:hypothetical protein
LALHQHLSDGVVEHRLADRSKARLAGGSFASSVAEVEVVVAKVVFVVGLEAATRRRSCGVPGTEQGHWAELKVRNGLLGESKDPCGKMSPTSPSPSVV